MLGPVEKELVTSLVNDDTDKAYDVIQLSLRFGVSGCSSAVMELMFILVMCGVLCCMLLIVGVDAIHRCPWGAGKKKMMPCPLPSLPTPSPGGESIVICVDSEERTAAVSEDVELCPGEGEGNANTSGQTQTTADLKPCSSLCLSGQPSCLTTDCTVQMEAEEKGKTAVMAMEPCLWQSEIGGQQEEWSVRPAIGTFPKVFTVGSQTLGRDADLEESPNEGDVILVTPPLAPALWVCKSAFGNGQPSGSLPPIVD